MLNCRFSFFMLSVSFGFLITLCGAFYVQAEPPCAAPVATLVSLQGVAEVRHAGERDWQPAALEKTFCEGDMIRVGSDSRAAVQLQNDALLRLDQETTLTFSGIENEETFIIELLKGAAHFFSRGSRSLKVVTPYANAAVEGTEFQVTVTEDEAKVSMFQGRVLMENEQGEVSLGKGQEGIARAGEAPASYMMVSPRDAVKWALYYPRVIQVSPEAVASLQEHERLVYEAEKKLGVGQVAAAEEDIDNALAFDPSYGPAMSLKSIIAVVNNQKEEALALAEKAVSLAPGAASSHIALSYARQAAFDLDGALAALEAAVAAEPENALAWARLSEIRLALGDMNAALRAAREATGLAPDLAHTQTVLGFAFLAQVEIDSAIEAFKAAILADSAAPLPHLGLGLARIRQGEINEGRRLLEVAAGLDPANSAFRYYLGKAYFEEKRDKFAGDQFAMAKELDPMDPTPWLYDAIRKQSTNQPVKALHDIYQSIQLNDNRAVYRSRLQLDQDLAARSVSLARIYNELGFQQLGLVEGRKSLNIDPGNYSAHRLMADSYSALPRHEIARVSELLQAQLLQPINSAPIQVSLLKTDLTLMESSILGSVLFPTDFSLMTQDELRVQTSGLWGNNNLLGGDAVVSGVQGRFSFSVGYNYFSTDGFRENNDQTEKLANAFAQVQVTHKTSLQAEYRNEDSESGDLSALFNPDEYWPELRGDDTNNMFRVGLYHQFVPGANFLFSGIYQDAQEKYVNSYNLPGGFEAGFELEGDFESMLYEVQQQFRFKNVSVSVGAGYFEASGDLNQTVEYSMLPEAFVEETPIEKNQVNVYAYTYATFPDSVTWTFGGDYSSYDNGETEGSQFSPKLGVVWVLSDATTLHAASFKTLRRMLPLSNQTIEPTQVAGFNQFFNDKEGANTWHYGVGMDHTFSPSLYGGIEYFQREIEFPFIRLIAPSQGMPPVSVERTVDWTDKTAKAYLYWTPHDWLSTALEIYYEDLYRDVTYGTPSNLSKSETCRVPLSVHFFHPNGIVAGVKETYVRQKGEFGDLDDTYALGTDAFWVTDVFVGYRLPNRMGTLTVEVRNLFNGQFSFQDSDPANPATVPERVVLGRITLSF